MTRRLLVLLAVLAFAAPASAATTTEVDAAAEALRSDPVYVSPDAKVSVDADEVRGAIARSGAPLFVAVLPGGGDPVAVLRELAAQTGRRGAYALIVGRSFRAGAFNGSGLPAAAAATAAFRDRRGDGVTAVLTEWATRVAGGEPTGAGGDDGDGGGSAWLGLLALLALFAVPFAVIRRRRRQARRRELEEVKTVAREDLLALADDVRELDQDVESPSADPRAKEHYLRAMEAYQRADDSFDRARTPVDLAPVTSALEESRYEMESAKARLAGREPPERRPPCFFDPRHGPSARDVVWNSPFAGPQSVPACEADAQRVERGEEPQTREVLVGGRRTPYWNAPAYYGPWAGGFFGGGLLPGLLVGSLLGSSLSASDAHAGDFGGGDGDGGGDFGGGDFGGGDFGGGDFGGGDVGGGDF